MERILAWYRVGSSVGALVALIVANAIPLLGVLFFGWDVWTILIVYWLENGIVGVFNVLKMSYAAGPPEDAKVSASTYSVSGRPADQTSKAYLIPFFCMHYGIFWLVHGVFVLTLPAFGAITGEQDLSVDVPWGTILVAVAALAVSHGLSFWWNFLVRKEYLHTSAAAQMFRPYGRLVDPPPDDHLRGARDLVHRRAGRGDRGPRRAEDRARPRVAPDRAPFSGAAAEADGECRAGRGRAAGRLAVSSPRSTGRRARPGSAPRARP